MSTNSLLQDTIGVVAGALWKSFNPTIPLQEVIQSLSEMHDDILTQINVSKEMLRMMKEHDLPKDDLEEQECKLSVLCFLNIDIELRETELLSNLDTMTKLENTLNTGSPSTRRVLLTDSLAEQRFGRLKPQHAV
jgi:hypothetical protein